MCIGVLPACMSMWGCQTFKLQTLESCHGGARNWTLIRSSQKSHQVAIEDHVCWSWPRVSLLELNLGSLTRVRGCSGEHDLWRHTDLYLILALLAKAIRYPVRTLLGPSWTSIPRSIPLSKKKSWKIIFYIYVGYKKLALYNAFFSSTRNVSLLWPPKIIVFLSTHPEPVPTCV